MIRATITTKKSYENRCVLSYNRGYNIVKFDQDNYSDKDKYRLFRDEVDG